MNQFVKFAALGCALLGIGVAVADTNTPTTFLGSTVHLGATQPINDTAAYNLLTEFGNNNVRVGATLGFQVFDSQYLKVSGEYLWQNIEYSFLSGNSKEWVNQGAVGAVYEYVHNNFAALDLTGYVSHANNKSLSDVTFTPIGSTTELDYNRRIAGSKAFGFGPGFSVMPWYNGKIGLIMNYDKVVYDTLYEKNHQSVGLGGTFTFDQSITDNLDFGVTAAIRAPFNTYGARINWTNFYNNNHVSLGLYGDYTDGKDALPNTWIAGLGFNYDFDAPVVAATTAANKHPHDRKQVLGSSSVAAWASTPAVYMPQVLAIAESRVNLPPVCLNGVPALVSDVQNFVGDALFAPITQHFSGQNLTYSIVSITPALTTANFIEITDDGRLFISLLPGNTTVYSVVARAANDCGAVLSNTFTVRKT